MASPQFTHFSVIAEDVPESSAFYQALVDAEPLPTPQFGSQTDFHATDDISIQILRINDQQLHLWNDPAREPEATMFAHFALHVDDFETVYQRAVEQDCFAAIGEPSAPPQVFELNGTAQMYLRDPTGNLFEIDHPNINALDTSVFDTVVQRETTGPTTSIYEHLQVDDTAE